MCVKSGLPTRTWVAMAAQVPGPQDRAEDRGARQEVHREAHDLDEADRDQRRHGIAELYGRFVCRRRASFIAASRVRNATAMPLNTRPARTADFEDEVTIGRGNAVETAAKIIDPGVAGTSGASHLECQPPAANRSSAGVTRRAETTSRYRGRWPLQPERIRRHRQRGIVPQHGRYRRLFARTPPA